MAEEGEKFRWDEQRVKDNEAIKDALDNKVLREKLFTEKFVEGLEKRRDALEVRSQKVSLVQNTMSLLLAIALVSPDMAVSLFGLSAKAGNFREILLLLLSTVQIYTIFPAIEQARISDVLHLYLQREAAGDVTALRLLRLRHGMGADWKMADVTGRNLSKWQKFHLLFSGIGLFLWVVAVFFVFVVLQLFGMISILRNPTVSTGISVVVCVYVVIVIMSNMGLRAFAGIGTKAKSPDKAAS